MSTLLTVRGLSRSYPVAGNLFKKNKIQVLSDISFDLNSAQTIAIVGESGCGKTTLARQITFLEKPDAGEILLDGECIQYSQKRRIRQLRRKIQMVFQNPQASLNPCQKIATQIEEPLRIHHIGDKAMRLEQVRSIMDKVGLRIEFGCRYPHMFSGGQCQRIAIARAMILNPKILVADEPTSSLDVSIQAQILNLFMDLQESLGIAYIFISHNLSVVEHIANEVIVMYMGRIVEKSDKTALFKQPLHPYTQALLSATPFLDQKKQHKRIKIVGELPSLLHYPTGCPFHERCPHAIARCREEIPILREIDNCLVACHRAEEINS